MKLRQYDAVIHGQLVTVTVVPPGVAIGACRNYRPNVRCNTYKYGGQEPKKERRWRRRQ